MSRATEESALSRRDEYTPELAPTSGAAAVEAEIQAAITVALRFPRNEDAAFAKLMKACHRTSFAEDAAYSFPRGKKEVDGKWVQNVVSGPSVNLAREAARVWGNIRFATQIIADTDDSRHIRSWAWDLESNTKNEAEDTFKKVIQRKREGKTVNVVPDERDLRELTNRRAAILVRNCILSILPKDLIEDAMEEAKKTLASGVQQDPEGARKKIILAFAEVNVTPEMLADYLGHPIGEASPAEIANLRTIYRSISDGNSRWAEYVAKPEAGAPPAQQTPRISPEQCLQLNKHRTQNGVTPDQLAAILQEHGVSVIAQIPIDRYDAIMEAVTQVGARAVTDAATPAPAEEAASPKPENPNKNSRPESGEVRQKQRHEIGEMIEALVETGMNHNQVMDIIELTAGARSLNALDDGMLPNVKLKLEAELKKRRKKK